MLLTFGDRQQGLPEAGGDPGLTSQARGASNCQFLALWGSMWAPWTFLHIILVLLSSLTFTPVLFIINSFEGSQIPQSPTFNLIQPRMLPDLPVNNQLFGIIILFNGNLQGILCRQNIGRSSKFCPSPTPFQPQWFPCYSSYMPDPLPPQGLCTGCFLCLESSFPHGLLPDHL